jgi:hypothetical protein
MRARHGAPALDGVVRRDVPGGQRRLLIYLRRTLTNVSSTVTIALLTSWGSNRASARIAREARSGAIWSAPFSTMPGSFLSS